MKRVLASVLGTVAGVVLLLQFKTHPATLGSVPLAGGPVAPGGSAGSAGSGDAAAGTTGAGSGGSSGAKTYTGDSVDTRWGPVQVRITVAGGKVTSSQAIVYPLTMPRDQQINSYAVPALNHEAVAAGSAKIDMISGATYTSEGYIGSLQSALNKAGL